MPFVTRRQSMGWCVVTSWGNAPHSGFKSLWTLSSAVMMARITGQSTSSAHATPPSSAGAMDAPSLNSRPRPSQRANVRRSDAERRRVPRKRPGRPRRNVACPCGRDRGAHLERGPRRHRLAALRLDSNSCEGFACTRTRTDRCSRQWCSASSARILRPLSVRPQFCTRTHLYEDALVRRRSRTRRRSS